MNEDAVSKTTVDPSTHGPQPPLVGGLVEATETPSCRQSRKSSSQAEAPGPQVGGAVIVLQVVRVATLINRVAVKINNLDWVSLRIHERLTIFVTEQLDHTIATGAQVPRG